MCRPCIDQLPWLLGPACLTCATPFKSDSAQGSFCGTCLTETKAIDHCWCAFRFETPIQTYVHGLKFSGRWEMARLLADLMAEQLLACQLPLPDALLAVPLHPKRLRERGYNQARILARHLAKRLKRPCLSNTVIRIKHTLAQARLKPNERKRNMANAFKLKKPIPYQHIALIDDVYTTGVTLNALATTIKNDSLKPIIIDAICLARALPRESPANVSPASSLDGFIA
jgi:ComF family protein